MVEKGPGLKCVYYRFIVDASPLTSSEELTDEEVLTLTEKAGTFDFLNTPGEDIYNLSDGTPIWEKAMLSWLDTLFTDLSSTRVRPALVISNVDYNTIQDDIILLLITSNVSRQTPDDYVFDTDNPEFEDSGLKKASTFRVGKIQTLRKELLHGILGFVGPNTIKEIDDRLRKLLQLWSYFTPIS